MCFDIRPQPSISNRRNLLPVSQLENISVREILGLNLNDISVHLIRTNVFTVFDTVSYRCLSPLGLLELGEVKTTPSLRGTNYSAVLVSIMTSYFSASLTRGTASTFHHHLCSRSPVPPFKHPVSCAVLLARWELSPMRLADRSLARCVAPHCRFSLGSNRLRLTHQSENLWYRFAPARMRDFRFLGTSRWERKGWDIGLHFPSAISLFSREGV